MQILCPFMLTSIMTYLFRHYAESMQQKIYHQLTIRISLFGICMNEIVLEFHEFILICFCKSMMYIEVLADAIVLSYSSARLK